MNDRDVMNGLQHSISGIDQEIIRATPATRRHMYRGEAWAVIDELLDRRNELTSMMSELIMDEYTELME